MSLIDLLPIPIAVLGVFFLMKLRFFFIVHPIKTAREIGGALSDSSSRKSLALALAGTLGVGNIVGVAYGLSVGGAGCLFWIFISGIFASVIKYAESKISADFRYTGHGGMMYVILASCKKHGRAVAKIYALLCLLLSLSMGSALQTESAAVSAEYAVGIKPYAFSFLFAAAVAFAVYKGASRIEKATAIIIPISTIVYIIVCISVILMNFSDIPRVAHDIISSALSFKSASGGILSFISVKSLKEGFARGLLSNEAGAGTSAMAQTRSKLKSSREIGLLGMCEVFFDTSLLCMLSGFCVLLSGVPLQGSGIRIILSAVEKNLGGASTFLLFLLIAFFAFSTVVCWYFYGSECVCFLTGREESKIFTVLFIISVLLGALVGERLLISLSDYLLFFMTCITLAVLLKNSERLS